MKSLSQLYDENPSIKEIDLSNQLLRDVDDIFSLLGRFQDLETVSRL